MKEQEDLFGEKRIQIKGDAYLNKIAQHIYDLVTRKPELLDGDSMNEIYRKIHLDMMLDTGLLPILTQPLCCEEFRRWYLSKECPTEEETSRATRGLIEADLIRLPAKVIRKSEEYKNRVARSLH